MYIIENKLGQFYAGITKDIARRLNEHQTNGAKCAKALRGKGPLTLKFCCQVDSHSHALKNELWIKKLHKSDKIRLVKNQLPNAPIKNQYSELSLSLLAECPIDNKLVASRQKP